MKKAIISLAISFLPVFCFAQFSGNSYVSALESETQNAMKNHVSYLSSAALEGRGAGTEGEKEAAEYVTEVLESYGLEVFSPKGGELFGLKQADGDTLTSRNVMACIQGYDKVLRDEYIVIGARLDNIGVRTVSVNGAPVEKIYYGANGNASGIAMLLELAKRLSTNRVLLKRSVVIAAFGASELDQAGSWYFINRNFKGATKVDAMVNLDMLGTGSRGFYVYTGSNSDLNKIVTNLSATLQPVQPELVAMEPVQSDHRSFYNSSIPATLFTTGMYPEYNSERDVESIIEYDWMERELEYIYNYTIALANGSQPEFNPSESTKRTYSDDPKVYPFSECDVKPSFLGSQDPTAFMQKWVYVYLKYPREAVRQGIQGRVVVDFIIDEKGKVRDVKAVRSTDPILEEAAVTVVEASPDWKPGRVNGVKVKTELSVNVEFRLERKK